MPEPLISVDRRGGFGAALPQNEHGFPEQPQEHSAGDRKTGQAPCSNRIGSRTARQWPERIPRQRGPQSRANVPTPAPRTPREWRPKPPARHRRSMQERSSPGWPRARVPASVEAVILGLFRSPELREPLWASQPAPSAGSPARTAQPAEPRQAFQKSVSVIPLRVRPPMVLPPLARPPRAWPWTPVQAGLATVWAQRP